MDSGFASLCTPMDVLMLNPGAKHRPDDVVQRIWEGQEGGCVGDVEHSDVLFPWKTLHIMRLKGS